MQKKESKVFAFKLAEKKEQAKPQAPWKVRDGVSTAGCTFPSERDRDRFGGRDNGMYCA